jgi:hypothetical protein
MENTAAATAAAAMTAAARKGLDYGTYYCLPFYFFHALKRQSTTVPQRQPFLQEESFHLLEYA